MMKLTLPCDFWWRKLHFVVPLNGIGRIPFQGVWTSSDVPKADAQEIQRRKTMQNILQTRSPLMVTWLLSPCPSSLFMFLLKGNLPIQNFGVSEISAKRSKSLWWDVHGCPPPQDTPAAELRVPSPLSPPATCTSPLKQRLHALPVEAAPLQPWLPGPMLEWCNDGVMMVVVVVVVVVPFIPCIQSVYHRF